MCNVAIKTQVQLYLVLTAHNTHDPSWDIGSWKIYAIAPPPLWLIDAVVVYYTLNVIH